MSASRSSHARAARPSEAPSTSGAPISTKAPSSPSTSRRTSSPVSATPRPRMMRTPGSKMAKTPSTCSWPRVAMPPWASSPASRRARSSARSSTRPRTSRMQRGMSPKHCPYPSPEGVRDRWSSPRPRARSYEFRRHTLVANQQVRSIHTCATRRGAIPFASRKGCFPLRTPARWRRCAACDESRPLSKPSSSTAPSARISISSNSVMVPRSRFLKPCSK